LFALLDSGLRQTANRLAHTRVANACPLLHFIVNNPGASSSSQQAREPRKVLAATNPVAAPLPL